MDNRSLEDLPEVIEAIDKTTEAVGSLTDRLLSLGLHRGTSAYRLMIHLAAALDAYESRPTGGCSCQK